MGLAQLTEANILRVIDLRRSRHSYKEISRVTGIPYESVRSICVGRSDLPKHAGNSGRWKSRLSESDVREMLKLRSRGMSGKELAIRYGVTQSGIYRICRRNRWSYLTIL
jgi:hypothetical protein